MSLGKLAVQALPQTLRYHSRFVRSERFVQFVGFPRSGHSLIGAVIEAHPDAVIAHELDVMGLINKRVPLPIIHGLIARNNAEFGAAGRWWNGLTYDIPSGERAATQPVVIGDKKGDWAARWCARDPDLLEAANRRLGRRSQWILVVRHPLDNIATMSLRKGRLYDRLRIAAAEGGGASDFGSALKRAQAEGGIPAEALDEMIEDYDALCASTEKMRQQTPARNWHEIAYEEFVAQPVDAIENLFGFLGLRSLDGLIHAAAAIVRPGGRSRDKVSWSADQLQSVAAIVERYPFLHRYEIG